MSNENKVRRAHRLLDYVSQGRAVLDDELKLLRSFLPDLPKQKTLEEIIAHVYDAWIRTNDSEWAGNIDNPDIPIEEWLVELHTQLQGLTPAKPAHPEFLETEADYQNAPAGTIAASAECPPWYKSDSKWAMPFTYESYDVKDMPRARRRVLRWGWGK